MQNISLSIMLDEITQVGEARRKAINFAQYLNFDETEGGKVGIVATEAANNIIKHARRGQIILRSLKHGEISGIEILALDKGSGIIDIERCMEDGYSTAGSPGTGLGAMKRLSSTFEIYSGYQKGTALLAQLWASPVKADHTSLLGGVCVPITGETQCGDGWAFHTYGSNVAAIAIDGLGHGPIAAKAADAAVEAFLQNPEKSPSDIMRSVHGALLSTRGATVSVAVIDTENQTMRYAGVGNISGMLFDGQKVRGLLSSNGTVGHQLHKFQELTYPWPHRAWLVLHSDGLYNRWKLEDYPGLLRSHPSLIAGIIYRDFQRGRDDAMAMVIKDNR